VLYFKEKIFLRGEFILESYIFLILILLVGTIKFNKSIVYATIFVIILKILFDISKFYNFKFLDIEKFITQFRKNGINWGVLVITIAILIPIATGEVRFYHLFNAFKSPIGWITIFSGILVSLLSAKGLSLLSNQPEITVTLIAGTIIGVVFLRGIAAGPVIASGITFCILKIVSLFLK